MLWGLGQIRLVADLREGIWGEQFMFPMQTFKFEYNQEGDALEAEAWVDGRLEIVDSAIGKIKRTLQLSHKFVDWFHWGFAQDELPQVSNNVPLPLFKRGTLPTTGAVEISDTDITASNEAGLFVYVNNRGNWGEPGPLKKGTTTPDAREFVIDSLNNKLVLHGDLAGASVTYQVYKTFSSIETLLYEDTADSFGALEFWGRGYNNQWPKGLWVHMHKLTRQSTPSWKSGDVPEFEYQFSCTTPPGKRSAVEYFNMSTAVA